MTFQYFKKRTLHNNYKSNQKSSLKSRFRMVVLSIFMQQKYFLLRIWAPQCEAMLIHSLPMKRRKRLAHDVIDTHATHADLLFITFQTQTAWHKMAARAAVFLRLSNVDFFEQATPCIHRLKKKTPPQKKKKIPSLFRYSEHRLLRLFLRLFFSWGRTTWQQCWQPLTSLRSWTETSKHTQSSTERV